MTKLMGDGGFEAARDGTRCVGSQGTTTQLGVVGQDKFIPRDWCIAIEAQDYVDGINQ